MRRLLRSCVSSRWTRATSLRSKAWFEPLCRDLFFESSPGQQDPYVALPFELRAETDYVQAPYQFPSSTMYSPEVRNRLCMGDPAKEYVSFCDAYRFPDRTQLPTSIGTEPARLWVDPQSNADVVFLQLSDHFPPALWLPMRGTPAAVRRVLGEFATLAAVHRDRHHEMWSERLRLATEIVRRQHLPSGHDDILRYVGYMARDHSYDGAAVREFHNSQCFFLGEFADPEAELEKFEASPFLFALPQFRAAVDVNATPPRADGPGVAASLFRCVHSKALIVVEAHLSAEVKLPPQDPDAFELLWRDVNTGVPKPRVPVFARVVWPDNRRLSGGGHVSARCNRLFGTEFAADMPVDAVAALLSCGGWGRDVPQVMGVRTMRSQMEQICSAQSSLQLQYPGTVDVPNPEYSDADRLAMHIQYLAYMNDPDTRAVVERFMRTPNASVRLGCAKAALFAGERDLFRDIVSSEPASRMRRLMTTLVRKRKSRDLTDKEPRLLDNQFEFPAPLWAGRQRIDPEEPRGLRKLQRGRATGKVMHR